jgi:hypothetical protein
LDYGSDPVSVAYSQKIGSKSSFCVSALFCGGLIAFLVIFGILETVPTVSRYSSIETEYSVVLPAFNMIFAGYKNETPNIALLDGNYNNISAVLL